MMLIPLRQLLPRPRAASLTALSCALLTAGLASAELTVPAVISSGMVLNQESSVPIWGKAAPGQRVLVTARWAAGTEAALEATADADGRWRVLLSTPSATKEPSAIAILTGEERIEIEDVLVGEVWLCSGQSNMEWQLDKSIEAARKSGDLSPERTSLEPSFVRQFTVPRILALEPQFKGGGQWLDASGKDALSCSAAAYFFAQRVQQDLDVPIGLIVSSWGGTPAQSWVTEDVASAFPDHAKTLASVRAGAAGDGPNRAEVTEFWDAADEKAFFARRFREADFDDAHWDEAQLPTSFAELGLGKFDGIVWFRAEVDVPPSWAGHDLELQLPPMDDVDETLWNGVRVGSEIAAGAWSLKRTYRIPGELVKGGQTNLTLRVLDTGGRGGFGEGEMRLVKGTEWIDLAGQWRYRQGVTAAQAGTPPRPPKLGHHTPTALYNAMIAPLCPFGIRGVLWYQGESNRTRAEEYRHLFPALIVNWRKLWNDLELPFYFVQIAPYSYGGSLREAAAVLREGQAAATRLPKTGMVLTADIGNPRDIHPKNKWEVGRRLALFALRDVYGAEGLEPDGPTFRSAKADGSRLVLSFDHVAGTLRATSEELQHFELTDASGRFVPATAEISEDGQSVHLSAAGIDAPIGARYLWNDNGESSISGGTGLPMAPFRTSGPGAGN